MDKYTRFMPVAQTLATMSKYPGTKVGAVVLGPNQEIRATGWNGAPRGSSADEDGRLGDRTERLFWATHAEANAIANAARSGASLDGCTMVITHMPCMSCAKLIVQSGIRRVIANAPDDYFLQNWGDDLQRSTALFMETGVQLTSV
jgi:dCMP deaminase